MSGRLASIRHLEPVPTVEIPAVGIEEFRAEIAASISAGNRIVALWGEPFDERLRLAAVVANDLAGELNAISANVGDSYPSLAPDCTQAAGFEREIAEQWGVKPCGHPWLKPLRFHHSYFPGRDAWGRRGESPPVPSAMDFFRVDGDGIHEVAVGPVHAGIIEPGHFRFQCLGEQVLHLEISLGYQHRGVEKALVGGPHPRTMHHVETLAGDTTIGHALAHCQALEKLASCKVPARAQALRAVALELERLANHTGDLGALAGDVGYLPTSSFCGRLRGDFLNMGALLCGSRFGRGMVRPGGVAFDLDAARADDLRRRLESTFCDVEGAVNLLWNSASAMARFENVGAVSQETARELGLVGPAARASGIDVDVRRDFPSGIYRFAQLPVSSMESGDVFARAYVRWLEIRRSAEFILGQIGSLPKGPIRETCGPLAPDRTVVSLQEGWRGEIAHVLRTDANGKIARYKIIDPSFHNWIGLAMALRGQEISDFPLCNKSFNLSYCGHDL